MHTQHEANHAHRRRAFRWFAIAIGFILAAVIVSWIVALLFFPWFFAPYASGFVPVFWFPFGFLFLIFFLLFAARWFFAPWRWGWGYGYGRPYWQYPRDPVEILRYRYARGEITREQFDQMMKDLQPRTTSSKL